MPSRPRWGPSGVPAARVDRCRRSHAPCRRAGPGFSVRHPSTEWLWFRQSPKPLSWRGSGRVDYVRTAPSGHDPTFRELSRLKRVLRHGTWAGGCSLEAEVARTAYHIRRVGPTGGLKTTGPVTDIPREPGAGKRPAQAG